MGLSSDGTGSKPKFFKGWGDISEEVKVICGAAAVTPQRVGMRDQARVEVESTELMIYYINGQRHDGGSLSAAWDLSILTRFPSRGDRRSSDGTETGSIIYQHTSSPFLAQGYHSLELWWNCGEGQYVDQSEAMRHTHDITQLCLGIIKLFLEVFILW